MNLVGKTQSETAANILRQAAEKGWTVMEDRTVDTGLGADPLRLMTVKAADKTVRITVMADGRMTREIK